MLNLFENVFLTDEGDIWHLNVENGTKVTRSFIVNLLLNRYTILLKYNKRVGGIK